MVAAAALGAQAGAPRSMLFCVKDGTLYALLRRLTYQGALTKHDLPGNNTDYRLAEDQQPH